MKNYPKFLMMSLLLVGIAISSHFIFVNYLGGQDNTPRSMFTPLFMFIGCLWINYHESNFSFRDRLLTYLGFTLPGSFLAYFLFPVSTNDWIAASAVAAILSLLATLVLPGKQEEQSDA